jgi:hypothetical protein
MISVTIKLRDESPFEVDGLQSHSTVAELKSNVYELRPDLEGKIITLICGGITLKEDLFSIDKCGIMNKTLIHIKVTEVKMTTENLRVSVTVSAADFE